jgi:hypothetical protein
LFVVASMSAVWFFVSGASSVLFLGILYKKSGQYLSHAGKSRADGCFSA